MASSVVELEISARAWSAKRASLTQEVYRRLQNTSKYLPREETDSILEEFTTKLKVSGYSKTRAREIINVGIKGY